MELKNRIIEIMENSGLTPSEFADKIEVQRSAISHITSGRNNPSLEFLIKIKNSFPEIDTDWLIFGIEKEEEIEDKNLENSTDKILQASLFESNEKEISTEEKKHSSNRSNKNLIRALLFFDDGSFEEYSNSDWKN